LEHKTITVLPARRVEPVVIISWT